MNLYDVLAMPTGPKKKFYLMKALAQLGLFQDEHRELSCDELEKLVPFPIADFKLDAAAVDE